MTSTGTQVVQVPADEVSTGKATYVLSGWLGGYQDQDDDAALYLTWQDAQGNPLAATTQPVPGLARGLPVSASIGPVTATQRDNRSELVFRRASGPVPAATRSAEVKLVLQRATGGDNDGLADNLSVVLAPPAGTVIEPPGRIVTVAGTGTPGASGDGRSAKDALLNDPRAVAVDSGGDLFIADTGNNKVREVDAVTGKITTVAGTGVAGFSGDGGPAAAAELSGPEGVAVDASGDVFIADTGNGRAREVHVARKTALGPLGAATETITTVAGGPAGHVPGKGVLATHAEIYPVAVAAGAAGDLFIADSAHQRVYKVHLATGVISTVAGDGSRGFNRDDISAAQAELYDPSGLALDAKGDLYIADTGNWRVREVHAPGGGITTVAGSGEADHISNGKDGGDGYTGDGGGATKGGTVPRVFGCSGCRRQPVHR